MTAYQPNIPSGLIALDEDYKNLRSNFQQINTTYNVDHVPLTQVANNGYHTQVHFNPVPTVSTVPTIGQLHCKTYDDKYSTDSTMFFLSGNGFYTQLTSNFLTGVSGGTNVKTFIPGGFTVQCGFISSTSSSSVVQALNFPQHTYSVFIQPLGPNSNPFNIGINQMVVYVLANPSKTNFTIKNFSGTAFAYYWLAIGN